MQIALYEPDIPQNTGTILRTCACLGLQAHIIEPAGFPVTDRAFRRAGMDYLDRVTIIRHASFADFEDWRHRERLILVLMTTAAERSYLDHAFKDDQIILFGRESAGVPEAAHKAALERIASNSWPIRPLFKQRAMPPRPLWGPAGLRVRGRGLWVFWLPCESYLNGRSIWGLSQSKEAGARPLAAP